MVKDVTKATLSSKTGIWGAVKRLFSNPAKFLEQATSLATQGKTSEALAALRKLAAADKKGEFVNHVNTALANLLQDVVGRNERARVTEIVNEIRARGNSDFTERTLLAAADKAIILRLDELALDILSRTSNSSQAEVKRRITTIGTMQQRRQSLGMRSAKLSQAEQAELIGLFPAAARETVAAQLQNQQGGSKALEGTITAMVVITAEGFTAMQSLVVDKDATRIHPVTVPPSAEGLTRVAGIVADRHFLSFRASLESMGLDSGWIEMNKKELETIYNAALAQVSLENPRSKIDARVGDLVEKLKARDNELREAIIERLNESNLPQKADLIELAEQLFDAAGETEIRPVIGS